MFLVYSQGSQRHTFGPSVTPPPCQTLLHPIFQRYLPLSSYIMAVFACRGAVVNDQPVQVVPSTPNPCSQPHSNDPGVLLQIRAPHPPLFTLHSSISTERNTNFTMITPLYNESTEVHNPRRDCAILTLAHETHQTDVRDAMHPS